MFVHIHNALEEEQHGRSKMLVLSPCSDSQLFRIDLHVPILTSTRTSRLCLLLCKSLLILQFFHAQLTSVVVSGFLYLLHIYIEIDRTLSDLL